MPNRIIRESILSSDRVESLDPTAEVFYRRLLSKVDDHGLYDARPSILRTQLFPLRVDRVREADCSRWIAACEKAGLIVLYQHAGKALLQVLNTGWQVRSEPKYPLPSADGAQRLSPSGTTEGSQTLQATDNSCSQPQTNNSLVVDVVVGVDGPLRVRKSPPKTPIPPDFAISDRVRRWAAERGHTDLLALHFEAFVSMAKARSYAYADWDEAFMGAIRKNWAGLASPTPAGEKRLPV